MHRALRLTLSVILVAGGLAIAAFFALLLGIADCSQACVERGERVPPALLIAAGLGLATAGALSPRGSGRRAAGVGLVVAGAAAAVGLAWLLLDGSRGPTVWALVAGLGVAAAGGALLARGPSR